MREVSPSDKPEQIDVYPEERYREMETRDRGEGPFGIFLIELANGYPSSDAGKWVKWVDWEFADGRAICESTDNPRAAMHFPDAGAAMQFYRTRTAFGRPLTAYTVEIKHYEED